MHASSRYKEIGGDSGETLLAGLFAPAVPLRWRDRLLDVCNVFKAFLGSNYLVMPFAMSQAGRVLGPVSLLVIAFLTDYCCSLIIQCKYLVVEAREQRHMGPPSSPSPQAPRCEPVMYEDLGEFVLGHLGFFVCRFALFLTQFGFCCGYSIFLGTTLLAIFNETEASCRFWPLFFLAPAPLLLFCSFIRNVRSFSFISLIANIAIATGFVSVLVYEITKLRSGDNAVGQTKDFAWSTFPVFFGNVTSSFEGIGTCLPIEHSCKKGPRRRDGHGDASAGAAAPNPFFRYLHTVIGIVSAILMSFGLVGYLTFGPNVDQIIIENLPTTSPIVTAVRVFLYVSILATYPLQLFPSIEVVEAAVFSKSLAWHRLQGAEVAATPGTTAVAESRSLFWQRNMLRGGLVLLTLGVGLAFRNMFAYLGAVVGAVGGSLLTYVLPCVFSVLLRQRRRHRLSVSSHVCSSPQSVAKSNGGTESSAVVRWDTWHRDVLEWTISVFGVVAGATSLAVTIRAIISA